MELQFFPRRSSWPRCSLWAIGLAFLVLKAHAGPVFTIQPVGDEGFDVLADGTLVAPIRLACESAIQASSIVTNTSGIRLTGLHTKDPLAVTFASDDFVAITLPVPNTGDVPTQWEPKIQFKLTITSFDTNRWLAMFPAGPAPFHFLVCSMPNAQVWQGLPLL